MPTFELAFVDSYDDIPEWLTGRERGELAECNFERMQDEGQSTMVIKLGEKVHVHRDGGESEDNTFRRDWHWVASRIREAYEQGVKDGVAQQSAPAHAPGDGSQP